MSHTSKQGFEMTRFSRLCLGLLEIAEIVTVNDDPHLAESIEALAL